MSADQIPTSVIGLIALIITALFAFLKHKEDAESGAFKTLLEGHMQMLSKLEIRLGELSDGIRALKGCIVEIGDRVHQVSERLSRLERGKESCAEADLRPDHPAPRAL